MFLIATTWAATWEVSTDTQLLEACADAGDGDTIHLDPGASLSQQCNLDASVTLRSANAGEVASLRNVVLNDGASGTHLEDLTFTDNSAALLLSGAEGVTATNLVLAGGYQNGIAALDGSISVAGMSMLEPSDEGRSAIYIQDEGEAARVEVSDCELSGQRQVAFLLDGSYRGTKSLHLEDCTLVALGASTNWGGILQSLGPIQADFTRVTFRGGVATGGDGYAGEGGAYLVPAGGRSVFQDCRFEDNYAHFGGALAVEGEASVIASEFVGNEGHAGAAIKVQPGGSLLVEDSWFLDNRGDMADDFDLFDWPVVAGIYNHEGELTLRRTAFCGNENLATGEVSTASTVQFDNAEGSLDRVVLHGNDANILGATLGFHNSVAELQHLSAIGNDQASVAAVASDVSLANSVFQGAQAGLSSSFGGLGHNAWVGALDDNAAATDFAVDEAGFEPGFTAGDCTTLPYLAEGSPLIDAGHPDTFDEDGSVADVGAFAFGETWQGPDDHAETSTWYSGGCGGGAAAALLLFPLALTRRRSRS